LNILIVEDQRRLAEALAAILTEAGYHVDTVFDGRDGLDYARMGSYDAIVLDVMLPKLNGFEVIRELRRDSGESHDVPVIMLTARDTLRDKITGLDAGADDYLTKPFQPAELLARLRALTRRQAPMIIDTITVGNTTLDLQLATLEVKDDTQVGTKGDTKNEGAGDTNLGGANSGDTNSGGVKPGGANPNGVNPSGSNSGDANPNGASPNGVKSGGAKTVKRAVQSVRLSHREFEVCRLLMSNARHTISKAKLLTAVWGMANDADENSVEAYVSFLRKKMRFIGSNLQIQTHRMMGYRLVVADTASPGDAFQEEGDAEDAGNENAVNGNTGNGNSNADSGNAVSANTDAKTIGSKNADAKNTSKDQQC